MNKVREKLSHTWRHIQSFLSPMIWDELGELTAKQKLLIGVLETIKLEEYLPYMTARLSPVSGDHKPACHESLRYDGFSL